MKIDELEQVPPVRYNKPWKAEEEDVLKEYYPLPKALPVGVLAEYLGRTKVSVIRKVTHLGLKRTS